MSVSLIPSVEERLRSSLVLCHAFKQVELLPEQRPILVVPGLTRRKVLRLLPAVLEILADQPMAIEAVLPSASLLAEAPSLGARR